MENLNNLLKQLLESKIDFVLIGGYAAVLHGSSQEVRPCGSFGRIKSKALTVTLFGHSCQVISLEDLIEVKKNMTRPKDLTTLRELQILQKKMNSK